MLHDWGCWQPIAGNDDRGGDDKDGNHNGEGDEHDYDNGGDRDS